MNYEYDFSNIMQLPLNDFIVQQPIQMVKNVFCMIWIMIYQKVNQFFLVQLLGRHLTILPELHSKHIKWFTNYNYF